MFDTSFNFIYLGTFLSENDDIEKVLKFRFKTHKNHQYIVDIEQYREHIYVVKYYLKNHRLSEHKYSFRTNEQVAHKIFGTCLNITSEILKKDKMASFGYVGASDVGENKANTKRYRIYRKICERFFSPINFTHYQNDKNSLYLMLNNENKNIDINEILKIIATNYEFIF